MAKSNLQSSDDTLFPLMDKVKDFLAGDCQVMLILGDSGAGKSTFNRHLDLGNGTPNCSSPVAPSISDRTVEDALCPNAVGMYNRAADELFMEAVITPFSKDKIEDYVERYVPLEARTWAKEDYMDKPETILNLMDLAKNPFFLTLCLETLPNVVQGKPDLSRLRVTRVGLYDNHWSEDNKLALDVLLTDGFERNGISYQMELTTSIF
ncbi:hypothetical protein BGZ47_011689 [Haplosporangium gracile]|nr:hypothetical protein BGZ47_011689 [Haplosporangium gracile]